jgi:antitoxin component of MazEF toxin-antitoxin module
MLAELLAQCDATSPVSAEEQEWQDMGQAGFEVW